MKVSEIKQLAESYLEEDINIKFPTWCNEEDLKKAFSKLNISAPEELVELLKNTNGVSTDYYNLVWTLTEIVDTNLEYWKKEFLSDLYMPFDSLLFFSDAGNGDLFAYRILERKVPFNDIYVWDHENDSRIWVASNLKDFIIRSLKGTLEY